MPDLKNEYRKNDTFLRRWGAVLILLVFFIASWTGQFLTEMASERNQAEQHGQQFSIAEFMPEFWSSTFENWQSEWLQLATQAILISGFSSYIFRKQDEQHYKTQVMLEDLTKKITAK